MRVIAGRLRGRRLRSVPGWTTRPTTGRARAALFDWIGPDIREARVLDLFAGTGAIGVEALSRGASHVTFVERDRRVRSVLEENLESLGLVPMARVLALDFHRAVRRLVREGQPYDLLFADPPYGTGWIRRVLHPEALPRLLDSEGALVVERDSREPAPATTAPVVLRDSRSYGRTRFDRYELRGE